MHKFIITLLALFMETQSWTGQSEPHSKDSLKASLRLPDLVPKGTDSPSLGPVQVSQGFLAALIVFVCRMLS